MGFVHPIRDKNALEKMKEYLREKNGVAYIALRIGLNLGLPVQKLLDLEVEELLNREVFTCENCDIGVCSSLQKEVRHYLGNRKTGKLFIMASDEPMTRNQLYGALRGAAKFAGIEEKIGSLSLRKTFAYWAYHENQVELPLLTKYLKHYTQERTLEFIGIDPKTVSYNSVINIDI